jgi:hypothetical protein
MAQVRTRLKFFDIVSLLFGIALGLAAAVLTFVGWKQNDALLLAYPLLPGLISGLLITGGHGGTATQEAIAPFVAALVNAAFYFVIPVGFRLIWRRLIARPTAYARSSPAMKDG